MYKTPIPLLIRNHSLSFNCENFIRGYHVYMKVWCPLLGECLVGKKEPSSGFDKNAAAVISLNNCGREEVVGHVPQNIWKMVPFYISLPHCYLELEVTGKCVTWNSLKVTFLGTWKGHTVVGNETNKTWRTIKSECKLLPQIEHKFLVEECLPSLERSLLKEDVNWDLRKVSAIKRCLL